MSETTRSDEGARSAVAGGTCGDGDRPGPADPPELRLAVVAYADSPDRCTVHPPGLSGIERMSTWISLDRSALVDIASNR